MQRRTFISQLMLASAAATLPLRVLGSPESAKSSPTVIMPRGKAEHCIFIWLGGGLSQIDTFDPKKRGNAHKRLPGTDYDLIPTAVAGVSYTEHLSRTARLAERITAVRTINHRLGSEHALATNFVHTGRPVSGATTYPSIGSIVANERGSVGENVPAYMLMGYPSATRGPGFLGAKAGYVYLVDTESGPAGLSVPAGLQAGQVARRQELLAALQGRQAEASLIAEYGEAQREALRLAGPKFMRNFNLAEEPGALRERYGGEFGQRCLLARRLVEAGVRFIEVSHNLNFVNGAGWDTHNEAHAQQHVLIEQLDTAFSALIEDLEAKGLLDKTLIAIGTEFGRPGEFDSRGGRGHQADLFTMVLAGGGLNHCGAYGVSDEISAKPVEHPVSVPDFHATLLAAMGINPAKEIFSDSRPVPLTDGGRPIARLFS
ncbi:MAG: DUF1501 domain-containing protein [Verrucomicrobiota bacterium]